MKHVSTPKADLQVRNLKSQLSFIITENDSLRKEVKSLNRSLSTFETSKSSLGGAIGGEVRALREELEECRESRDTALKEILILKQVSSYYKNKDDQESRDIENEMFTLR